MFQRKTFKRYPILIWILFFALPAISEQQDYYFKQISLEQGLSQSRVQCIYRDHLGVMWIGTKWGLNSYDQSELKNYFYIYKQPNSLPDNYIRFITEDPAGHLFVSTNKGVAIYDKTENLFHSLPYKGNIFQACRTIKQMTVSCLEGKKHYTNIIGTIKASNLFSQT